MPDPYHIVVIGGGITGLSAALRLSELSDGGKCVSRTTLLEASDRLGGTIGTLHSGNFLMELGPDSIITEKPWGLGLCAHLGLENLIIRPQVQHQKLYTVHNGALLALPEGFLLMAPTQIGPMLRTPLFSWRGKVRMAAELVLPRGRPPTDESLASFVRRRLGSEVLERVAQPLIGGVYAADPEELSLTATMPRFAQMEREQRSIILATRRARQRRKRMPVEHGARWSLFVSLGTGMGELVRRIERKLPPGTVQLGERAEGLTHTRATGRWLVRTTHGEHEADALICAQPAFSTGTLLAALDPSLARELLAIRFTSTATVNLGYRRSDIPHPLDGFGFVVPAVEGRNIIACTFSSVKYAGRAPSGCALLRCFVGGALQEALLDQPDEAVEQLVMAEMEALLGIEAKPIVCHLERYPRAMPQYNVGHLERLRRIKERLGRFPTLCLAGKSYRGVGIADCIHSGEEAAEKVAQNLARRK